MAQVRVAGSVCENPQENMNPSLLKLLQAYTLERCKNSIIGRKWQVSNRAWLPLYLWQESGTEYQYQPAIKVTQSRKEKPILQAR